MRPLVADLLLENFLKSLSLSNIKLIDVFNSTYGYLDDLFDIDNKYFDRMVHRTSAR